MSRQGRIRAGIGGWNYEPWRETFYPAAVTRKDELAYASRQVTAIEINSTFYRLQKPHVFAGWRDATPDDFMFSVKAPRYIAQRAVLADAQPYVERFIGSGVMELGTKLGPLLWQLAPNQQFEADDLRHFLEFLPHEANGVPLRHALEVRHQSFATPEFLDIARANQVAVVFEDDQKHPGFADLTGDFVYARLRRSLASEATGYSVTAIQNWVRRARTWVQGDEPTDLPRIDEETVAEARPRDVFVFFINGAKERAPAAAMKFIEELAAVHI